MAFSPQFLDEVRARVGLADVVGRRVRLTRKGREFSGLCPFHNEKTPSFTVNEQKGFYHCFGCGAHGSVFDYVMETEALSFRDAVERLAAEAGLEVPLESPEETAKERRRQSLSEVIEAAAAYYAKMLREQEGKSALAYLRDRGVDDTAIARFGLGYAPDGRYALKAALARDGVAEELMVEAGLLIAPESGSRASYDRFRDRLMFPIADRKGRTVGFGGRVLGNGEPKYLNSPETPLFQKGRLLYGLPQARKSAQAEKTLIVVEGYMDVIALSRAGLENAVAPLGTALTEEQIHELWRTVPEPVFCFDSDNAGYKAATRAALRALPLQGSGTSLRFAFLPAGQDPDSLIREGGSEAFRGVLARSIALSEMLWRIEAQGKKLDTVEDVAKLKKALDARTREIKDYKLKIEIENTFKDYLYKIRKTYRKNNVDKFIENRKHVDPIYRDYKDINKIHEAEKILLAIIIYNPSFFDRIEEEIGTVSFDEPSFEQLRCALISVMSGVDVFNSDDLEVELRKRNLGEALEKLFQDQLVRTHRLIRSGASQDDIEATWRTSFEVIWKEATKNDRATELFSNGASKEDWEKWVARKRARLEEGDG